MEDREFCRISPLSVSERKRKKARPKVEKEWSDDDIFKLIELVEERRPIWDKGMAEYKLPKQAQWEEISMCLESKFAVTECKAKWANLRVTFNANVAKYRSAKSGQGTDEKRKVVWRYYKSMLFLEATDVRQSTQSASSIDLLCSDTDQSVLAEVESPAGLTSTTSLPQSPGFSGTSHKRSRKYESPKSSISSELPDFKSIAAQAHVAISQKKSKNKYEVFCEYIATELQALPEWKAEHIKRKLNRTFLDLMDEVVS